MIDSHYISSGPYRGDPNAPTCQACGAMMVQSGIFDNVWVCLSCGERYAVFGSEKRKEDEA